MISRRVPEAVIRRLPEYYAKLCELEAQGVIRISSMQLSQKMGLNASQIRQDLNYFGGFGQQGYGYNVKALHTEISRILGLDRDYKMIIVGCGNLGQALANYTHYYKAGFIVCGMFDINPRLVGLKINDIEVMDYSALDDYLEKNPIDIGIICTNKGSAQEVAEKLVAGKVKGIWNFATVDLTVSDEVALENVHLSDSLQSLAYYISHRDE